MSLNINQLLLYILLSLTFNGNILHPSLPGFVHKQVTEALDRVKTEMEEKGSNMIDAGPLVRIKQTLTRLKTECTQMDVRTGVVRY